MANLARYMAEQVRHRGPDAHGIWCDEANGIALAHQRLAILDLSLAGAQPMQSRSARYVLVLNGEIYNHLKLRQDLDAKILGSWRGHSDTETLLAGFDAWGIHETLRRTVGMFALAVWDKETRTLILARDRLGEKPLYYGWQGSVFMFASELKALRVHPAFTGEIDRDALCLLLRYNYVPAPYSIYRGISKLLPGTLLTVSFDNRTTKHEQFWSLAKVINEAKDSPFLGDERSAIDSLEHLLRDAIGQQMVADVPVGAFLSGGVDSSTVVALMQAQSARPVKTFSIGYLEGDYNEAKHAETVAHHLGTEHTELYVTPSYALEAIPKLSSLYCEPFSDSSQIATFLVAQLARRSVTVSLSGDAGDEVFCGYNRYTFAARAWRLISLLPIGLRRTVGLAMAAVRPHVWSTALQPIIAALPAGHRHTNVGDKLHKVAGVLASASAFDLYQSLVTHWQEPARVVIGGNEPLIQFANYANEITAGSPTEWMMALDLLTYLPDDILVKIDRAAMGVSLETRVPFLDHRVVEFAWRLPLHYKIRNGVTKWVLRQILHKYVPKELVARPKTGFAIPIDGWLRGPLRDWAETLLAEDRLKKEGFFNPEPIRRKWCEHLTGRRNWHHLLWDVLMFQSWFETQSAAARETAASQTDRCAFSTR
jgi:asparagine synthase (glutamine-hydrolysing)